MGDARTRASTPAAAAHDLPLSTILEALNDGIVVLSADGAIVNCNASAERILGLTVDEMTGRTTHDPRWEAIHEDGSPFPGDTHPVSVSLRTGQPVFGVVMGIRRPSGELTWISINSQPIFPPGQTRPSVVASFADVTELRRSAAALSDSEASFRLLFECNPLPMWVYDRETLRFLAVNEAALQNYGYSREEFERLTLVDIRPPAEVPRFLEHSRDRSFQRATLSQGQWRHRTRDGRDIDVEISTDEITFQGRSAMLAVARDVTEHHKLQAQLLQLQKMEAVSRLAGGVAHDFNNLLSVVSGYTDLLARELPDDDLRRRRIALIRKALESGAALTRQLLMFSRREDARPGAVDLGAVVKDLEPMIARLVGEEHQLITRVMPGTPRVRADRGHIEQVILNLAVNARDAMPAGGKLIVETKAVLLDAAFARTHPMAVPGPHVMLSVSDTGCGMDEETRSRIFEPFFTTKAEGKGTGLGLSTVYAIVKQAGGHIGVYSEVGQGTTFNIYFPLDAAGEADAAAAPAEPAAAPGSGTVLLVEDGDALRAMMRELLEESGYSVLEAATPDAALSAVEAHAGGIDLLLTDIVMPGMRGPELAERLRRLRPTLAVLFMSGYTDETVSAQGLLERGAQFIQKPFSAAALLTKVAAAIAGEGAP